jgi:hypothetical protein
MIELNRFGGAPNGYLCTLKHKLSPPACRRTANRHSRQVSPLPTKCTLPRAEVTCRFFSLDFWMHRFELRAASWVQVGRCVDFALAQYFSLALYFSVHI